MDLPRPHRIGARHHQRLRPSDHRAGVRAHHLPHPWPFPLRDQRADAAARRRRPLPRIPGLRHRAGVPGCDRHRDRGRLALVDPARLTGAGRPDFVVVTGLSGSGKSQAVKVLEDLGYYTLDNLPPPLMATALDVSRQGGKEKVAFVIDSRSGPLFADARTQLDALDRPGVRPHLLFFDASDDVLLRRYSETRHRHPVDAPGGVQPSIDEERRLLVGLRARADKVIDTTHLSVKDLRDTLHSLYGSGKTGMLVHVESFGS